MNNFKILFKKDILEIIRTKKWLVYLISFFAIVVLSVVTARLLPELFNLLLQDSQGENIFSYEASIADSYTQFIANMGEISWLLIVIMFANTLTKEKNKGTYSLLKSNGVSEKEIVLSHFFSKLLLITVSYLLSVILFMICNLFVFHEYAGLRGVISLSYLYLSLVFALCLSIFVSSIVKKNSRGIVLVIIVYFVLTLLSIFPYIDIYNPMYSLTLANNVIVNSNNETSDFIINLIVTLTLSISLLLASIYLFRNKIDNKKEIYK